MLAEFTSWLLNLLKQLLSDLWQFVVDAVLYVFEGLLNAIASLIGSLQVPDFVSAGLSSLFSGLDPGVLWLSSQLGVTAALSVIGGGFTFRLVRKLVTVFQW